MQKKNLSPQSLVKWEEIESRYHISFFNSATDETEDILTVLDDIYLLLTPKEALNLIQDILKSGDILFMDCVEKRSYKIKK